MAIKWSGSWESLGSPPGTELSRPFVRRNQDGRLEVFALGAEGIFNIAQLVPNGAWRADWLGKGRPSAEVRLRSHVVGTNADGRLEIFALGDDQAIWQRWQVAPNDGWSEWKRLGAPANAPPTERFTVGRNQDRRQEVFVVASDGNAWQIWQTAPNGGWSDWRKLGAPSTGLRAGDRITIGSNEDGRQELFAMGGDDAVWHVWQQGPNVGWSDWESLGTAPDRDLTEPLVERNADGHLEVFAPGNGTFCNRWQEVWREGPDRVVWRREGWNEKPKPASGIALTWIEAALNFERHLEIVALGDDGALWHAWQVDVSPFWSHWESLGSPPAQIRPSDRLTVGTNQDGRLEAFVVGQDGAVWHTWQIR